MFQTGTIIGRNNRTSFIVVFGTFNALLPTTNVAWGYRVILATNRGILSKSGPRLTRLLKLYRGAFGTSDFALVTIKIVRGIGVPCNVNVVVGISCVDLSIVKGLILGNWVCRTIFV